MGCYVLDFQEIDQTQVAVVGGKGAQLGSFRGSRASVCRLVFA
jgi:phosphoenolpyruvate synthase/pyruvate phosphate dikinase